VRQISIRDEAPWLQDPALQKLLAVLSADGEQARIAGGAVRNALLGEPVHEVDIATTALPQETVKRAEEAGFRTVPTGIEHGTVTVICHGVPYEVTTLRDDVETDGRRARVAFGRDWRRDAERRDFTINALYAEADGSIIDLVGGIADLDRRVLRFIGDAEDRIREDYLRILRFFRFFAWYGAGRPDAAGIKACARLRQGMSRLSAERVWAEMKKLLEAPDPSRALLWMRQTGVLTQIMPETEKWGIDAVPALIDAELASGWSVDPLTRLMAMLPPDPERLEGLARRLKLSRVERDRLVLWSMATTPSHDEPDKAFAKRLYLGNGPAMMDRLKLALASARARAHEPGFLEIAAGYRRLLTMAQDWRRPRFPLGGADLGALGVAPGKEVGRLLKVLETEWMESGFAVSRDTLLERAAQLITRPN
jgi:poly(A) polymerase